MSTVILLDLEAILVAGAQGGEPTTPEKLADWFEIMAREDHERHNSRGTPGPRVRALNEIARQLKAAPVIDRAIFDEWAEANHPALDESDQTSDQLYHALKQALPKPLREPGWYEWADYDISNARDKFEMHWWNGEYWLDRPNGKVTAVRTPAAVTLRGPL